MTGYKTWMQYNIVH